MRQGRVASTNISDVYSVSCGPGCSIPRHMDGSTIVRNNLKIRRYCRGTSSDQDVINNLWETTANSVPRRRGNQVAVTRYQAVDMCRRACKSCASEEFARCVSIPIENVILRDSVGIVTSRGIPVVYQYVRCPAVRIDSRTREYRKMGKIVC